MLVVATDIEKQARFYQETLGLHLQFRDGNRWVQFQAGDVSFALADPSEAPGVPQGASVPVFEVTELDGAVRELAAGRYAVGTVRDMGAHGRTVMVNDPGGACFVLFQKPSS